MIRLLRSLAPEAVVVTAVLAFYGLCFAGITDGRSGWWLDCLGTGFLAALLWVACGRSRI